MRRGGANLPMEDSCKCRLKLLLSVGNYNGRHECYYVYNTLPMDFAYARPIIRENVVQMLQMGQLGDSLSWRDSSIN